MVYSDSVNNYCCGPCSKTDSGLLVRVIPIFAYMLEDQSTVVIKRLLASVIQIYRLALLVSIYLCM